LYELPREMWENDIDAGINYFEPLATEGDEALIDSRKRAQLRHRGGVGLSQAGHCRPCGCDNALGQPAVVMPATRDRSSIVYGTSLAKRFDHCLGLDRSTAP
jgi:hypothetical protein